VRFEPATGDDRFWNSTDEHPRLHRRPVTFSGRMFNVGWKGWTRLVIVCVIVGAIFQAGGFNPFAPGFTVGVGAGTDSRRHDQDRDVVRPACRHATPARRNSGAADLARLARPGYSRKSRSSAGTRRPHSSQGAGKKAAEALGVSHA